jgi:hypothetical protein
MFEQYGKISQLITVYIYHKHERPWFFPRLLIVTTLIKSIKKCQQSDEIYANRYKYNIIHSSSFILISIFIHIFSDVLSVCLSSTTFTNNVTLCLSWKIVLFFKKKKNIYIYWYIQKKMHYYKCPKLNNRVKLMLMNKNLNNYLFMLFLVNKLYHVYILIFIVILFYLMLRSFHMLINWIIIILSLQH